MLKNRSGCRRKPRRSVKPTINKSLKPTNPVHDARTHSTANQTAKGQACGVRRRLIQINVTTNLNTEMKKLFVAVTIACLGTILVSMSAQTPSPSPDASAGEEGIADENTDRTERCDCPSSPDGKFAFLTSDTEEDSFGDRLQIIDLIEKKSGKKLQRIDDAAMPVLWNVLWAPDSNGFALKTKVVRHPRLQGVDAYFRSGETFQKTELPNLPDDNIAKEVVWAPDSKRLPFNYMVYSPRTDYETFAF